MPAANPVPPNIASLRPYQPLAQPMTLAEQALRGVWPPGTPPWVTVICLTYNHAPFIEDCIEGFLAQRTTFPVCVFVHDDASTDGTTEMIQTYAQRFPGLFQVVVQPKNLYSQGISVAHWARSRIDSPYLADCEGDDYWTDPDKLQTQIDYLEAHPECVITSADARIVDAEGAALAAGKLPPAMRRDWSSDALLTRSVWILTLTRVYRNVLPKTPIPERSWIHNGDKFLVSLLGRYGSAHFHSDWTPASYRVHGGGIWSSRSSDERHHLHAISWYWIYRYWERVDASPEARRATNAWFGHWMRHVTQHGLCDSRSMWRARWRWRFIRGLKAVWPKRLWPGVLAEYLSPSPMPGRQPAPGLAALPQTTSSEHNTD